MIGAPAGTKMSHGTPNTPAANARAWAWLPALPAVTPWRASSPSDDSLLIAPRILNAPVRCRLSAFSTTLPPASCDSATDEMIGVCVATVDVTVRAARMSSSVTCAAMPPGRYCPAPSECLAHRRPRERTQTLRCMKHSDG